MTRNLWKWLALATSGGRYRDGHSNYTQYDLTKLLFQSQCLFGIDGYRAHCFYTPEDISEGPFNRSGVKTKRVEDALYPKALEVFSTPDDLIPISSYLDMYGIVDRNGILFYELHPGYLINHDQLQDACSLHEKYELYLSEDPHGSAVHIIYRTAFPKVRGAPIGSLGMVTAHAKVMPLLSRR